MWVDWWCGSNNYENDNDNVEDRKPMMISLLGLAYIVLWRIGWWHSNIWRTYWFGIFGTVKLRIEVGF